VFFLALRVWLIPKSFRIAIPLLIPLMIIKIVSHLSDCFGIWSLILYWNLSQTSGHIKLNVISVKYVLIGVSYLYVFVAFYTLIVVTCQRSFFAFNCLNLCAGPLSVLAYLFALLLLFLLLRLFGLRRRRWFSTHLNIVRWKKAFDSWLRETMTIPPASLISLLN